MGCMALRDGRYLSTDTGDPMPLSSLDRVLAAAGRLGPPELLALAWSDSAREAALLERRGREKAKPDLPGKGESWDHPDAIGGHSVRAVYSHPASPKVMYDLGSGLHAEGKPGGKPGSVLRSDSGLDHKELAQYGWTRQLPPKPDTARKPAGKVPAVNAGTLAKVTKVAARTAVKPQQVKTATEKKAGQAALAKVNSAAQDQANGVMRFKNSKGIDRADMPQLSGTNAAGKYVPSSTLIPQFISKLQGQGVGVKSERVRASSLRPTQTTGDSAVVRGIADNLKSGKLADPKPIVVSKDGHILDGHHTWAGKALADKEGSPSLKSDMPVHRVDMPIEKLLAAAHSFQKDQGIKSRKTGEIANPEFKHLDKTGATGGPLDDTAYHAYADKLDEALTRAAAQKMTTEHTHSHDGGKTWDPERAAIHDDIVDKLMAKYANVPREGKAIIAGGLGGAGKSTVLKKDPDVAAGKYATVNPDDIKEELAKRGLVPDLPGMPEANPMERSGLTHEESSHVAGLLTRRLLAQKTNVVHDITMSSQGSVQKRVDALRAAGYGHVHGMFVHIPVEKSVESARARHREGLDSYWTGKSKLGERFVPSGVIRSSARTDGSNANRETFEGMKPSFDSWALWDRSGGGDAKLAGESKGKAGPGKA